VSAAPVNTVRRAAQYAWQSYGGALAREYACLAEVEPNSPRIRPTLAPVAWLDREPSGVTEMRRAA
jgi:hypothetical protein